MLTRLRWKAPTYSKNDPERSYKDLAKSISDYLLSLEKKGSLTITEASIDDTVIGGDSPGAGSFTTVTASGLATAEEVTIQSAASGADLSGKWQASGSATTAASIFGIAAYGWDGDSSEVAGTINFRATETWSSTARGTRIQFRVVPNASTTLTEQLSLEGDGRLHGKALHNNAGDLTGTTNQYIASGTYTPTATNVTNIGISNASQAQWSRTANTVTVSGAFTYAVSGAGTCRVDLSLPIASALANAEDLSGSGATYVNTTTPIGEAVSIFAEVSANTARLLWVSAGTSGTVSYIYQYEVL